MTFQYDIMTFQNDIMTFHYDPSSLFKIICLYTYDLGEGHVIFALSARKILSCILDNILDNTIMQCTLKNVKYPLSPTQKSATF